MISQCVLSGIRNSSAASDAIATLGFSCDTKARIVPQLGYRCTPNEEEHASVIRFRVPCLSFVRGSQ